ncbi:hypothetical protein K227x_51640 [Rubripirellula lacrimiformis]|uniref:Uncharacterized protein n=1 Tax=Rubripirellula lacrimiformis TaxID=1930273 RepID=A0A517NI40_9BACT|nr:hypothetical protein [Rubripirellula lacrimiformis]QDT06748.1 hypothetical protein K227x_51640 [Rubripirellula lacrimiformis]
MNIQSFLEHHGIVRNPFAEEDAQTDQVFKEHCISSAYHPIWDKVYGDPKEPSTSIVFGPKGSGKTAMRLQIDRHIQRYNRENVDSRVFVIRYDDFNPFLDHFCERMSRRTTKKSERVFDAWRLWDHMDSILCIGVTDLVDRVLREAGDPPPQRSGMADDNGDAIGPDDLKKLDRTSARDLLLLATCYDQSTASAFTDRWTNLRKHLRYGNASSLWPMILAIVSFVASMALVGWLFVRGGGQGPDGEAIPVSPHWLWLVPLITLIGGIPFWIKWAKTQSAAAGIRKHMRVGKRETGTLRKVLMKFPSKELDSQPLPRFDRTDDRYEMLNKFRAILSRLGYGSVTVLMDRVDEPDLIGGKPELMQRFVWPMLDNKLLKHQGIGFKLFLPQELHRDVERETREFHERARLDKQNVIPAFQWTGEALYDLARARMLACAADGRSPEPKDLFDDDISYERLLAAMQSLRVPRHLFRLLYRVLVDHCNRHTDAQPVFKIKGQTFESALAVYSRDSEVNNG